MSSLGLAFVGHMCFDRIIPLQGEARTAPGSAVLCGALAAARIGREVAVVTKMSPADEAILEPMRRAGVQYHLIPAAETTFMEVIHPSQDVDDRRMFQRRSAGYIRLEEVPVLSARHVHLAGITDQEFTIELIEGLKARGWNLSADMQSFVRQVNLRTREIAFADVPDKRRIVALLDKVKLDVVEARILTGHEDLERAAVEVERWGCPEVVITRSDGVLARVGGQTYFEKFSNRSVAGRTGRGDTTFAGYLAWRADHDPAESLRFAAAMVSIKMETPGPFAGTLADVLDRMGTMHSR